MAENIISPGVFTRENDLSFLPQGIGQIGAAVVGPTKKDQHLFLQLSVEVLQNTKQDLDLIARTRMFH